MSVIWGMTGYAFLKYLKEMIGADFSSRGEAVEQHVSSSIETHRQDVRHTTDQWQ